MKWRFFEEKICLCYIVLLSLQWQCKSKPIYTFCVLQYNILVYCSAIMAWFLLHTPVKAIVSLYYIPHRYSNALQPSSNPIPPHFLLLLVSSGNFLFVSCPSFPVSPGIQVKAPPPPARMMLNIFRDVGPLNSSKHAWYCHVFYPFLLHDNHTYFGFSKQKAPLVIHTAAVEQEKRARPSLGMEYVIRSAQLLTVWEMDSTASKTKTPACKKPTWNMLISHKTNQEK